MTAIGDFTRFLLEAHHVGGEGERPDATALRLALAAGQQCEDEWTMSNGALLNRRDRSSLSTTDGVITAVWPGWKTREWATDSVGETLNILAAQGIVAWLYAPMVMNTLDDICADLTYFADHASAEVKPGARAAASYVEQFWGDRHRELIARDAPIVVC